MRDKQPFLIVIGLAIVIHIILLSNVNLVLKTISALVLTGVLPGFLLVELLVGKSKSPPDLWEKCIYIAGTSLSFIVTIMLLISYLPGNVTKWHTLVGFDLVLFILLAIFFVKSKKANDNSRIRLSRFLNKKWLFIGLISLLLIGGFYRFVDLDFSEFRDDEAEAIMKSVAVIQGREDVLFFHRKGPSEILIPAVIYSLTDHLTEQTARLVFSLASLAGLFAVFLLGWRLFGPIAGWSAAILLALNGYFIGFGRILQYQSLVFLLSVSIILIFYRLVKSPESISNYLVLAALFFATGLFSHFNIIAVVIPSIYLFCKIKRKITISQGIRILAVPLILGFLILSLFFIPYIIHPNFEKTYENIAENRIGIHGDFPYDNLERVIQRSTLYNSSYYFALITMLVLLALMMALKRSLKLKSNWFVFILMLCFSSIVTFWLFRKTAHMTDYNPVIWFTLAVFLVWLIPRMKVEERMLWLWFSIPMLIMLFFVALPRSHVYIFIIPWILLCGMVINRGWQFLKNRIGMRNASIIAVTIVLLVTPIFSYYAYWYFIDEREVLATWSANHPEGFWTAFESPTVFDGFFGFPHKRGWKAVSVLYQTGILNGTYDANSRNPVTVWYMHGTKRVSKNPSYFIWSGSGRLVDINLNQTQRLDELKNKYKLFGSVMVRGRPQIQIFQNTDALIEPQIFDVEDYEKTFDSQLTDPFFPIA